MLILHVSNVFGYDISYTHINRKKKDKNMQIYLICISPCMIRLSTRVFALFTFFGEQ